MITGSWVRDRRVVMPRLLPRRVRSFHALVLLLVVALIGWGGWTWYRGSSFVKVQSVTVSGLSGPDITQIRAALTDSALTMTTLNVDITRLESAVSRYPYVQRLTVSTTGSHALLIHVDEQVPVALVKLQGQSEVVDADAQILPAGVAHGALPTVALRSAGDGQTITAPGARAAIAVLAAAPYAMLAHVADATSSSAHGVIVQLRNGPQLYFGPASQLSQKWAAVLAVLQDKGSVGAAYIDVSDPRRPAAGAGVSQQRATALGLATSGVVGPSTGSVGGGTVATTGG